MKTIALLAAFSFSYSGSSTKIEHGSGVIKEESRSMKDFQGLSVGYDFRAQISPGPFKVQLKGDDNILPLVEADVSRGVLRLRYKEGVSIQTKNPVEVFIQAPVIDSIQLSGGSRLHGNLATRDTLEIDLSGGSQARLGALQVKNLDIDGSGGSTLQVEKFAGKALDIDSSGGSTVTLDQVTSEKLTINASGASTIHLAGTSEAADIDISGGVRVNANELKAKNIEIQGSGASDLQLRGARAIKGELSGGASLHASKSARVDVERSRAARVVQD